MFFFIFVYYCSIFSSICTLSALFLLWHFKGDSTDVLFAAYYCGTEDLISCLCPACVGSVILISFCICIWETFSFSRNSLPCEHLFTNFHPPPCAFWPGKLIVDAIRITSFLDFVHHLVFLKECNFSEIGFDSVLRWKDGDWVPTRLGPLERAITSHSSFQKVVLFSEY